MATNSTTAGGGVLNGSVLTNSLNGSVSTVYTYPSGTTWGGSGSTITTIENYAINLGAYLALDEAVRKVVDKLIDFYLASNDYSNGSAKNTLLIYGILEEKDALSRKMKLENVLKDDE